MRFGLVLLVLGAVLHLGAAGYYVSRFVSRRRPISLVVATLALGWLTPYAMTLKLLPPSSIGWLLYVGLVLGVLHALAIFSVESQR